MVKGYRKKAGIERMGLFLWFMTYLWFKSLHIIGFVTWFAGLFYLARLFVYHAEAKQKTETEWGILHPQFSRWKNDYFISSPGQEWYLRFFLELE